MSPTPSALAFVPFVSVHNMMALVHHIGIEPMLCDIASEIEDPTTPAICSGC